MSNYSTYQNGVANNVFLKSPNNPKENYIGRVWPGDAVFPDFFAPNTKKWWQDELNEFQQK
jgi:alpha-glucosidase